MRHTNMMSGFDMEQQQQHSLPPMNPVPTFQPYDNNNSMFNGHPQYHSHPHHYQQGASNHGPGMSTPPSVYLPYEPFNAPPSHPLSHGVAVGATSTVYESNDPHFMGHGYKRKSLIEAAPPSSSFSPEEPPYSFLPHYVPTYPHPVDQRSVRSRVGAVTMGPPYSHGHDSFFLPPRPIWDDQHCNDYTSDGSSSLWLQPPSVPFMHDSGIPRFHEASSSRNDHPFVHPTPYYVSHPPPPPPPPTVYPRMASASYNVPLTIHDTSSYRNVGSVQSTGFRINQQHPRDDFSPPPTVRHSGRPLLRAFPADEGAGFWEGDFYDDFDDHHQDMRLDIDDMSYEELLDLSDHIGTVKTGLSEETVKDLVKRRTFISTRINLEEAPSTDLDTDSCPICQENYKNQDKMVTLDCKHEYHAECLEKWLVIKNVCPICKSEALVMDQNKERSSVGGEVSADSN